MRDRAVIVTGAAGGLGQAESVAAAEMGFHIYMADIGNADEAAGEIRRSGGSATSCQLDVTDEASWQALLTVVESDGRELAGLVNNAGISFRHGFEETTPADWRRVLEVNLTGAFIGIRSVAPLLAANSGGSIVNISSIAGMIGFDSPAYGASKWGLIGLGKSAAGAWADRGVRVNTVMPGLVDTRMLRGADAFIASSLKSVPAGRPAKPSEIARVVRFLLSPDSEYISGADFVVDGGLTSNGIYHRIIAEL